MTWFANPANETESANPHNLRAYAIDADFPSGHVRLTTWIGSLTIDGNSYLGVGHLGKIQKSTESVKLTAERRTYQLSGVDPSLVPESEIDNCYGRSFTEYKLWLHTATHEVIGYEISWEGRMNRIRRVDGPEPIIEVATDHRLSILEQPDGWRYTGEHQKAHFFSGDLGLDFASENNSLEIIWGGQRALPGGVPGGRTGDGRDRNYKQP